MLRPYVFLPSLTVPYRPPPPYLSSMSAVRIALSQFRPNKGEYAENVARIGAVITQAAQLDPKPDLVVFPETATSGYFVEGGVKELAVTAGTLARELAAAYGGPTIDVVVGFYERFQNHIHNSALYVTLSTQKPQVRHVHRKVFLPTYGVFDEERSVDRGKEGVRSFETGWGGKAAILSCEDAWHSLAATVSALEGAQLVIVPSASPARGLGEPEDEACEGETLPASVVRWERIVRGIAEEHGVFVALANLVGFEGGKGFPGASAVIDPTGRIIARGPLFEEALLTADIDLDALTTARSDSPLLADLQSALPVLIKGLGGRDACCVRPGDEWGRIPHPASRIPCRYRYTRARQVRPPRHRSRAHPAVVGEFCERRGRPPPQFPEGHRRPVGRGGFRAHGVPGRGGTRQRERDRRAPALSHLQPRESRARAAGHRQAGHPRAHDRHLRRRRWLPEAGRRCRSAPARQRDGARADDRAVRSFRQAQGAAARYQQQIRAAARLLHLARRRCASGEPAGRSVQDAGLGARAACRST